MQTAGIYEVCVHKTQFSDLCVHHLYELFLAACDSLCKTQCAVSTAGEYSRIHQVFHSHLITCGKACTAGILIYQGVDIAVSELVLCFQISDVLRSNQQSHQLCQRSGIYLLVVLQACDDLIGLAVKQYSCAESSIFKVYGLVLIRDGRQHRRLYFGYLHLNSLLGSRLLFGLSRLRIIALGHYSRHVFIGSDSISACHHHQCAAHSHDYDHDKHCDYRRTAFTVSLQHFPYRSFRYIFLILLSDIPFIAVRYIIAVLYDLVAISQYVLTGNYTDEDAPVINNRHKVLIHAQKYQILHRR